MAGTVVYLASFVLPLLPPSFIVEQYSEIYARLPSLLQSPFLGDAPLVRATLGCLRKVFVAFPSGQDWQDRASLQELYSAALGLCLDERPKVRRAAQDAVCGPLMSCAGGHPALSLAVQVCKMVLQGATRKETGRAMHVAPLLKRLVPCLDQSSTDGLLGPVMQAASLGNTHLATALLAFLEELARVKCDETGEDLPRAVQLNLSQMRKMLEGLGRLKPAASWDSLAPELHAAWLTALGTTLSHPSSERLAADNNVTHLRSLLDALASPHERVHLAVQLALSHLCCPSDLLLTHLTSVTTPERISMLPYLLAIIRDQVEVAF